MVNDLLTLALGLLLLVKGGEIFVGAAVRIAGFLRMPRVVIGSTIVSLATTTPEVVVSVVAASRGSSGLAVGNALGSCIFNIGAILGATALLKRVEVHPAALRPALMTMIGLGFAVLLMGWDLELQGWQGMLLLAAGAVYFAWDFFHASRQSRREKIAEAACIEQTATRAWAWFYTVPGTAVQFALAAALVVFSSRLVVDAAVNLAARFGVPPLVVGLTVVAVGTSLPELMTAIGSARCDASDLSVGNIIGANIANLSIVIGAAATLKPVKLTRGTLLFDFPAMLLLMALLVWTLWTQHRLSRREGVILMSYYVLYFGTVTFLALRS